MAFRTEIRNFIKEKQTLRGDKMFHSSVTLAENIDIKVRIVQTPKKTKEVTKEAITKEENWEISNLLRQMLQQIPKKLRKKRMHFVF